MAVKEEVKKVFKLSRKTFFDPRAWFGYDMLKEQTQALVGSIKGIFSFGGPGHVDETFEEAMARFNLTEKDIQELDKSYFSYAVFFALIAVGIVIFAFAFLLHGYFFDFLIAFSVSLVLFSQAFKYHFWHFQIKNKKLGCTFEEWRHGKINHEG